MCESKINDFQNSSSFEIKHSIDTLIKDTFAQTCVEESQKDCLHPIMNNITFNNARAKGERVYTP